VIAAVRERSPTVYLRVVAGLVRHQVGITSMREDAGAMTDEELARALLHANETLAPVILSPDVGRCRITVDRAIPIAGVSAGSSRVSRRGRSWRESVEPKRRCRLHPTEGVVQQCRAASRLGTSSRWSSF
jgi:hypothetical protein